MAASIFAGCYLNKIVNARADARAEQLEEPPITVALLQKVCKLLEEEPDYWDAWGHYDKKGEMTAFEYKPNGTRTDSCRLRISKLGDIEIMTNKLSNSEQYVIEPIELNATQKKLIQSAYERLKSEKLLRMLDRVELKE